MSPYATIDGIGLARGGRMNWRSFGLAGAIVLVYSAPTAAATVLPIKFEELVAEALTIVRGEVVSVRSEWRDRTADAPIVTRVTVRVEQTLKGQPRPQLELEFLGGTVGAVSLKVSDMPQFAVGERDLLFVNDAGRPASPLVGFFAGRWIIHVDAFTRREFLPTAGGKPLTNLADVDGRPAQSLSTMRRPSSAALSVGEIEVRIREQVRR
jgi:hypothetical protein